MLTPEFTLRDILMENSVFTVTKTLALKVEPFIKSSLIIFYQWGNKPCLLKDEIILEKSSCCLV